MHPSGLAIVDLVVVTSKTGAISTRLGQLGHGRVWQGMVGHGRPWQGMVGDGKQGNGTSSALRTSSDRIYIRRSILLNTIAHDFQGQPVLVDTAGSFRLDRVVQARRYSSREILIVNK